MGKAQFSVQWMLSLPTFNLLTRKQGMHLMFILVAKIWFCRWIVCFPQKWGVLRNMQLGLIDFTASENSLGFTDNFAQGNVDGTAGYCYVIKATIDDYLRTGCEQAFLSDTCSTSRVRKLSRCENWIGHGLDWDTATHFFVKCLLFGYELKTWTREPS